MSEQHVFIGMPCGRASPDVDQSVSMTDTIVSFVEAGLKRPERRIFHGNCYVHFCRNMLTHEFFWRTNCTHLFFWDDDVSGPSGALRRLLSYDRDIAVAPYPKKLPPGTPPQEAWPYAMTSGIPDESGLLELDLAATGFMLIKREVIAALYEKHADRMFFDPKWNAEIIDLFPTGLIPGFPLCSKSGKPRWWGEDNAFSIFAKRAGFKIWLDPVIPLMHAGRNVWKGEFTKNSDAAWAYEAAGNGRAKEGSPFASQPPRSPKSSFKNGDLMQIPDGTQP